MSSVLKLWSKSFLVSLAVGAILIFVVWMCADVIPRSAERDQQNEDRQRQECVDGGGKIVDNSNGSWSCFGAKP